MANVKISELPLATSPLDSSVEIPVVQGGVTKRAGVATTGYLQAGTSAALRTAQDKMRDWVAVEDFGAVGDGVTDDTAAIQAAFNTGWNVNCGSQRKTYRITNTLVMTATNQQLDMRQSVLNLDDATGLLSHIRVGDNITQSNGIAINNIIFTRTQVATAGAAIFANFVGVFTVQNCRVFGNDRIWRGIFIQRGLVCRILDNYIQNTVAQGIFLQGTGTGINATNDIKITGNRIEYTGGEGLSTYDFTEGLYVRNNIFFAIASAAVYLDASAKVNALVSFKFEGNDYDSIGGGSVFYVSKVSNVTMADSWFSNNAGTDVRIESDADSVVINCGQWYTSPGQIGIQIAGTDVNITGIQMLGGAQGIVLKSTAARVLIDGNTIRNMTSIAVNAFEGPTDITIGDNAFGNNAADVTTGFVSPTVASADPLPLLGGSNVYNVTGTTNFGAISNGYAGRTVTLIFSDVLTVFTSVGGVSTVVLDAGANFTTAADNTLTLAHNGTRWYEIGRKV
ncbi:MAG: hypothetical protein EHM12_09830 [Dehalococcoidia bacterium]|nr:MAG: hypothetical protein EHM12_09830 [Dehalococcoidia bacterium]